MTARTYEVTITVELPEEGHGEDLSHDVVYDHMHDLTEDPVLSGREVQVVVASEGGKILFEITNREQPEGSADSV